MLFLLFTRERRAQEALRGREDSGVIEAQGRNVRFGSEADMSTGHPNVRFVPQADIA